MKQHVKNWALIFSVLFVLGSILYQMMINHNQPIISCVSALFFLLFPKIIQQIFKIYITVFLEISFYLFIIASSILGEVHHFYENISFWDLLLHFTGGFLATGVGLSLLNLLITEPLKNNFKLFSICLFSFCFSMSVSLLWESLEYSLDKFLNTDAQKDTLINTISSVDLSESKNYEPVVVKDIYQTVLYNQEMEKIMVINGGYLDIGLNDTMSDLFINAFGASVYIILLVKKKSLARLFMFLKDDVMNLTLLA